MTWYMKGQSNYDNSTGFHMGLYFDMNGFASGVYDTLKMPDDVLKGDPFLSIAAETKPTWNPGTQIIEMGLWDHHRIKFSTTGISGWHEGSGVWIDMLVGGGGGGDDLGNHIATQDLDMKNFKIDFSTIGGGATAIDLNNGNIINANDITFADYQEGLKVTGSTMALVPTSDLLWTFNGVLSMGSSKITNLQDGGVASDAMAFGQKYTNTDAITAVNTAGLSLVTTKVYSSVEENYPHLFGKSQLGVINSGYAYFGRRGMTTTSFAVRASLTHTVINVATGNNIDFFTGGAAAGVRRMRLSASALTMSVPIAMGANDITLGAGQTVDTVDISAFKTSFDNHDGGDVETYHTNYYTDSDAQAVSINNLSEDSNPQLGGDLDLNDKVISIKAFPATDHHYEGTVVEWTNAQTFGKTVYMTTTAHTVGLAGCDSVDKMPAVGISVASNKVLTHGIVRDNSWAWGSIGKPVYVSTSGNLTQTPPSTTGYYVQIIGIATSLDSIHVKPSYVMIKRG